MIPRDPPEEVAAFLTDCGASYGIGVDLRNSRHLAGDFVSFDGETLRLEATFGRPRVTMLGGVRPDGPIIEIPFDEIDRVQIEYVIEDKLPAA